MNIESNIKANIESWLNGDYDEATKKSIQNLIDTGDETTLIDSFYRNLEFGTGGLRGIMGPGSNRMNKYTVGTATQGLANYLNKTYPNQPISVAISYDSRNLSKYFAEITADVFSANNIKVYFFKALRPTPLLSFAIRELGCKSGVMVTASHNPKEYNGYKAYGEDGGQLVSPADKLVMKEVADIKNISEIKFNRVDENIEFIGSELDTLYLRKISELSLEPEIITQESDLKIVYTPIHGTGITIVPAALLKFGFRNIHVVKEQEQPDGNFPTVIYPNPEEKEAMTMALSYAEKIDADLVLATDPDADRVGIAVKDNHGKFILLNGNQSGSLLVHYLLDRWNAAGKLTGKEYIVKTIVTSDLIAKISKYYNVDCFETLTGFKYIGALITELQGKREFIGGGEESYGLSVGELVRDKDAVISCAFIAEMTAFYKNQGKSLFDALIDIYIKHGFYKETLLSLTKKGKSGAEEIKSMMEKFRSNPPSTIGNSRIIILKDYEKGIKTDLVNNTTQPLNFPKSDVLQFITENGNIISARPSGTEPKIKFYCSINSNLNTVEDYEKVNTELDNHLSSLLVDLGVTEM
ncbi:phospho-sugar mutase [Pedobacter flavus]|uniref:Phospho-sugar mutase n=1 Tax=Pedobacter flavus TaxID=3113906 RepID=A0ABU7H385_9SPHI|nr:phospho-sugar mutase [Pedobacter sp. VNH31]MEE1885785.1 phospho-sugar mutase [Pedobacter sp. VNH31]